VSYLEETEDAQSAIRARLELAFNEKLIEVIERLAADSEQNAARINYHLDTSRTITRCCRGERHGVPHVVSRYVVRTLYLHAIDHVFEHVTWLRNPFQLTTM